MDAKDLIKGQEYWYTDGEYKVKAKHLYSSINHAVFSCSGENLSLSTNEVKLYITQK